LFNKRELQILQSFFNDSLVIKADLKDSLRVLSDLFKDMKLPPLLERRIIESFLYANETVSTINQVAANPSVCVMRLLEILRVELFPVNHGHSDEIAQ